MKSFLHITGVVCTVLVCVLLFTSAVRATDLSAGTVTKTKQSAAPKPAAKSPDKAETSHSLSVIQYRQYDPAWANYLYGGQDPMSTYGCGPTALAIAAASLTGGNITPVDAAVWAANNGYYAPQSGSVHALIPDGGKNYGLTVEVLSSSTPKSFCMALSMDKLLILLMGPGDFSDSGHFIVAYGYDSNGNILVADPASEERSLTPWPASTLISQLSKTAYNGGPVWALSK